jgi:hypothetical protein
MSMPPEKTRHQLLGIVTAFRLQKGRWPATAFELASFARGEGRDLDLSAFHLLRFGAAGPNRLAVDWTLHPGGDGWAECGWLLVWVREQGADSLSWGAEWADRPKALVEGLGCFLPSARRAG